jgi:hypothetical protein
MRRYDWSDLVVAIFAYEGIPSRLYLLGHDRCRLEGGKGILAITAMADTIAVEFIQDVARAGTAGVVEAGGVDGAALRLRTSALI